MKCPGAKRLGRIGELAVLAMSATLFAPEHARAHDISIIGSWQVVEAAPAPWSPPDQRAALEREGKGLLNLAVTFAASSVASKFKLFNCKRRVLYESVELPVDTLFQGNLPEPNPAAEAARMGFPRGDIPSIDVRCINAKFTFHFRDANTALINLNRVIYTFKRQ